MYSAEGRSLKSESIFLPALLIFASVLVLYLSTFSVNYFVDGLNFAKALEDDNIQTLYFFHPHHLLYAPTVYLLYRVGTLFGYTGRTVAVFQLLGSIMGALGVSVFFLLMRRLGSRRFVAVVASLFLAFSYGYWYHSVNVKSTVPALALLLGSLYFLMGAELGSLKSLLCGILHGGTILLHAVHVVWIPSVIVFLAISHRRKSLVEYLLGLISSVGLSYLIVVFFVAKFESATQTFRWATLYLHSQSSYWDVSLSNLLLAARNIGVCIFGGHFFFSRNYLFWPFLCTLAAVLGFLLYSLARLTAVGRRLLRRHFYVLITLSLTYGGIHLFWCPYDYSFWVIQLIPLSALFFLSWTRVTRKSIVLLLLVVGAHFGLNLLGNIVPKHLSSATYVEVIHKLREDSTENDLFIILGLSCADGRYVEYVNPNVHYFLGREYITLPQIAENPEQQIERIRNRMREGKSVYLWWDFTPHEIEKLQPPYREVGRQILCLYGTEIAYSEGEYMVQTFVRE